MKEIDLFGEETMNAQEWEYCYVIKENQKEVKVVRQDGEQEQLFSDMMSILAILGSDGWELVHADVKSWQDEYSLLLKRPN